MTVAMAAVVAADGYLSCRDYFVLGPAARGLGFCLVAVFFVAGGTLELYRIASAKRLHPSLPMMLIVSVAVATHPLWGCRLGNSSAAILAAVMLAGLFFTAVGCAGRGNADAVGSMACTCLGAVYLGLGVWFVVAIRLLCTDAEGAWGQIGAVAMFLACVKSTDIGAYLIGRRLGRHKLIVSISPAKTWEGSIGGLVVAVIVASLFAVLTDIMSIGLAVVFGAAVGVAGQLGDLLESMLKRDAGVKDSARLVPEFGGMLDLLDSVLTAAPLAYLILVSRAV